MKKNGSEDWQTNNILSQGCLPWVQVISWWSKNASASREFLFCQTAHVWSSVVSCCQFSSETKSESQNMWCISDGRLSIQHHPRPEHRGLGHLYGQAQQVRLDAGNLLSVVAKDVSVVNILRWFVLLHIKQRLKARGGREKGCNTYWLIHVAGPTLRGPYRRQHGHPRRWSTPPGRLWIPSARTPWSEWCMGGTVGREAVNNSMVEVIAQTFLKEALRLVHVSL